MLSERAKMKLIPVYYYGFTGMDRRFSSPMLPWIVAEIRKRDFCEKVSLGVEDGVLQAYNPDFELQFSHKVSQMTRFSQADLDPTTFLYLLRDDGDRNLYCYLFQARKVSDVTELYKQMKEQNTLSSMRSANSVGNLTSLCVDISPSLSNFFEVLYVGKIKVWTKKVPESFIDDALEKFKAHETEKHHIRLLANIGRLKSAECLRRTAADPNTTYALKRSSSSISHLSLRGGGYEATISNTTAPRLTESEEEQLLEGADQPIREVCHTDSSSGEEDRATSDSSAANHYSVDAPISTGSTTRANSASESSDGIQSCGSVVTDCAEGKSDGEGKGVLDLDDHNRTMVLQVDRTDLRLISPDRKVILLHKHHRDVTTCLPGIIKVDYFGFVCKEANNSTSLTGYIFKCESSSIAADAVSAITQAFSSPDTKPRTTITSCEQCPMVFFHKLCVEIEHLSDRKTQAAILRRLEHLPDDDRHSILSKHRSHSALPVRDQNEHLMALLRAHSEASQASHRHVAPSDPRSVQTSVGLSHAGGIQAGGTLFTKARRSLSNSFDQLLKRRSRDDLGQVVRDMNLPLNRENSPAVSNDTSSDRDSEGIRSRSSTIGSRGDLRDGQKLGVRDFTRAGSLSPDQIPNYGDKGPKSPMMDIFLKVGTSPRPDQSSPPHPAADGGSWRQAILKSVVAQGQAGVVDNRQEAGGGHTKEELRALWRKSIHQAVLLVRMEKENDRLKAKQEESAVKRIKLEYDEMKLHQKEIAEVWDMMSSMKESKIKIDRQMIQNAIRQGIPRGRRGEVWQYLSEHYTEETPHVDSIEPPGPHLSYEKLLKQLTAHQHAILIDLGRTFPNHSYFSSPLGPGQLALFNLLKAYSLLDPEVGYCQGLSFVAGVLLLHMEESQAFSLLRHLMWTRGLRAQYLPDMAGLQVRLYQLSRLLHDHLPALYHHLDLHEVPPTLYAAPWLLTVFASQFPLGFVTRVFDLVFLESPDVVFRVALALLTCHSDQLLACESFEEIMNYMKTTLSQVDKPMLDLIMHQVFSTDISAALREYSVEYAVLREEMGAVQAAAEAAQAGLEQRLGAAEREAEVVRETAQRESEVRRATERELRNERERCREGERRLEVLAEWIGATAAKYPGLEEEIPNEVRRIVTEACGGQRLQRQQGSPLMRMFHRAPPSDAPRTLVKSMSTGKIGLTQPIECRSSLPNNGSEDFRRSHYIRQPMDSPIREDDAELTNKLNNNTPLLPLATDNRHQPCSPTSSTDSGISAPGSPRAPHGVLESPHGTPETLYEDSTAANTHPLSNCDVTFSYAGTKQLRHVGSLKGYCRNSSPDMLRK